MSRPVILCRPNLRPSNQSNGIRGAGKRLEAVFSGSITNAEQTHGSIRPLEPRSCPNPARADKGTIRTLQPPKDAFNAKPDILHEYMLQSLRNDKRRHRHIHNHDVVKVSSCHSDEARLLEFAGAFQSSTGTL